MTGGKLNFAYLFKMGIASTFIRPVAVVASELVKQINNSLTDYSPIVVGSLIAG
jgi:hypothetical protein